MSRTFQIPKAPYEKDQKLYKKTRVTLKPGLTVLVGCNGAGKSTLMNMIEDRLQKLDIPVIRFDMRQVDRNAMDSALFAEDFTRLGRLFLSSEGGKIRVSLERISSQLGSFILRENAGAKEIWILIDALDSGFSIDNISEAKEDLFNVILDNAPKGTDIYIVASANAYELARDEQCFDVINGMYRTFEDYEDFRNFVLETRKLCDKRST